MYGFGLNHPHGLEEIAFGAKCDLKNKNVREISNIKGGATWSTPYIHPFLVNIVYKLKLNPQKTLGEIAFFVKMNMMTI